MRTAGIAELKAKLSEYLAFVRDGEEVVVTDRGRPIARISRAAPAETHDAWMAEMERKGQIRPPIRKLDETFWARRRSPDPRATLRAAVLAEREEGW